MAMASYIFIAIIGATLFCFYWWGLNSFLAPKIAAYEAEQRKKEHPTQAEPVSRPTNQCPNISADLVIDDLSGKDINFHFHLNNPIGSPSINNLRYRIKTADITSKEYIPSMSRTLQRGRDFDINPALPHMLVPREYNWILLTLLYSIDIKEVQREFASTYRFVFTLKQSEKGNIIKPDAVEIKPVLVNDYTQLTDLPIDRPVDPNVGTFFFTTDDKWLEKTAYFIEWINYVQKN